MGCDIHAIIQKKESGLINKKEKGKWKTIQVLELSRNYYLFSVLADVRNFYTDPPLPFISVSRGFPKDFEEEVRLNHIKLDKGLYSYEDEFWLGDHGFSYLSLAEINNFKWDRIVKEEEGSERPLLELTGRGLLGLVDYYRNTYTKLSDYRMVFGCDS